MFDTVLVANRGEIACRVIDTLRGLGIRSVAVYSDADAHARHVRLADVAIRLGSAGASDSYLNIAKIIDAARDTGVDAIHPGYGFLAENAEFARACAAAGVVFIGPGVDALTIMGDKIRAKNQVMKRSVPVVPGIAESGLTDDDLYEAAMKIGFPILIKPSAGGGGKGMQLVRDESRLREALASARREAASSFGDDTLFIERFVENPRHIEVQILADEFGATVHLGERECSLQRRHQKVIEEAPSPLLDPETRARIGQAAVETARSVDYRGAGTVEFIVSADAPDEFFFMEMNTRLQVEHPVTELVTGVDLVEWQLRIAAGEPLDFGQNDVTISGHAIEARIYAEDPESGFLPSGGVVLHLEQPTGDGIRVDSALIPGLNVSSDYDPMLAKVITWGANRDAARQRLQTALDHTVTLGVTNNVQFLKLLLDDPDVVAGDLDTGLIDRRLDTLSFRDVDEEVLITAALVLHAREQAVDAGVLTRRGWRIGAHAPSIYRLRGDGELRTVSVLGDPDGAVVTVGDGHDVSAAIVREGGRARVTVNGATSAWYVAELHDGVLLSRSGAAWHIEDVRFERAAAVDGAGSPELRSPMPGAVAMVFVEDGAHVEPGDAVVSIEAMKMEHVLRASHAGRVSLNVDVGTQVTGDELLAVIEVALEPVAIGTDGKESAHE